MKLTILIYSNIILFQNILFNCIIIYIFIVGIGNIFDKIKYNNIKDLCDKLILIISNYDSEILINLLINNKILNYDDVINILLLQKLNKDINISAVFSDKNIILFRR